MRSSRRRLAGAAGVLLVLASVLAGFALRPGPDAVPERPPAERPELLLLTSLPIVFPETFTLETSGSPVLAALQRRYRIVPISTADARSLDGRRLLLMAQPPAQPAEVLVELDAWVRGGGRVLLLADPMLEWPSERPLGDLLRPPMTFADTGLLGHWGLRLDGPEKLGPATLVADGRAVQTSSPGTLVAIDDACSADSDGLVARCTIGRGEALVVADADFIDVARRREPARSGNLGFLLRRLAELER